MPVQRAGAPQADAERAPARRRLRATVDAAYARFVRMEQPLQERLLAYLASKPQARLGAQPINPSGWALGYTQGRGACNKQCKVEWLQDLLRLLCQGGHDVDACWPGIDLGGRVSSTRTFHVDCTACLGCLGFRVAPQAARGPNAQRPA